MGNGETANTNVANYQCRYSNWVLGFGIGNIFTLAHFFVPARALWRRAKKMAEGVGFEPTVAVRPRLISSQVRSTRLRHPSEKRKNIISVILFFRNYFYCSLLRKPSGFGSQEPPCSPFPFGTCAKPFNFSTFQLPNFSTSQSLNFSTFQLPHSLVPSP